MIQKIKSQLKEWIILVRETWTLLKINVLRIIGFVAIYSILSIFIYDTIYDVVSSLAMKVSGLTYIGPDTISKLVLDYRNIIPILIVILMLMLLCVLEISGIMHACTMGKIGKKTTILGMFNAGLYTCKRTLHPKNWLIFIFMFIIFPLTGILSFCSGLVYLQIPEFIMDYINANTLYHTLYIILYIILVLCELVFIFSLNSYIIEEKSFFTACKESLKIIKGNYIRVASFLIIAGLVSVGSIICISTLVSEGVTSIAKIFDSSIGSISQNYYASITSEIVKGFLVTLFTPVFNIAAITVLYFQIIEERNSLVRATSNNFNDRKMKISVIIISVVFLTCITVVFGYLNRNLYSSFKEESSRPAIVAHRGDSVRAPENTIPAFELAIEENVTWVEFDVHQTKDGVIIVSHDDDLTRVSGKPLRVQDLNYEETKDLDVGSWFSPEFSYVRLATFDEVLKLFKDTDIQIQVEIKNDGNNDRLVEKVLAIINENELQDRVIITSLNPEPLIEVNELQPDMVTVYSMYIAWNGVENIEFSKALTIEEGNYNRMLVGNIHAQNKLCFAWTANTEDTIQYLVDCGVDGILTDNPIMLENALDKCDYSGGVARFFRLLIHRMSTGG